MERERTDDRDDRDEGPEDRIPASGDALGADTSGASGLGDVAGAEAIGGDLGDRAGGTALSRDNSGGGLGPDERHDLERDAATAPPVGAEHLGDEGPEAA
jgi:hypothetical protein